MKDTEGVARTHLETEVPEITGVPMWRPIRRFNNEGYFFPIGERVKPIVHDVIAEAGDRDITGSIVLGRHMNLYTPEFQEEKLTKLASREILSLLKLRYKNENLEETYERLTSEIQQEIQFSSELSSCDMGALEFAFRFGEAVAFGHLNNLQYDTEHTYLPTDIEVQQLNESNPSSYQLTQISGLHTAWQARNSMRGTMIEKPSPFIGLIHMRAWGGHNFSFKDDDINFDIYYGKKPEEIFYQLEPGIEIEPKSQPQRELQIATF